MKKCPQFKPLQSNISSFMIIVLLSILLIIALISYSIYNTIPQLIDTYTSDNLGARMIMVSPHNSTWTETELNYLLAQENVELLLSQRETYWGNTIAINNKQINAEFLGAKGSMYPQKVIGKKEDLTLYEVIIPSTLITISGEKLNGIDYIGSKIVTQLIFPVTDFNFDMPNNNTAEIRKETIEFVIAGVYDEKKHLYFENQIFTTTDTIKALYQTSYGKSFKDIIEQYDTKILLADTYDNAKKIEKNLINNGYEATVTLYIDYALLNHAQMCALAILSIALFCITICVFCLVILRYRNMIFISRTNYGLQNTTKFHVKNIHAVAVIILMICISTALYYMLTPFIFYSKFYPHAAANITIYVIVIFLISTVICSIYYGKQLKK